jgi:hypothetical protein
LKSPKDLEKELGITLPPYYRTILEQYPFERESQPDLYELFGDIDHIIEENLYYRQHCWFGRLWPAYYLVIGEDGLGNVYFIDTLNPNTAVYNANHDEYPSQRQLYDLSPPIIIAQPSLEEYVKDLKRDIAEGEEMERVEQEKEAARQERRRNKKWWQFWI